MSQEGPQCHRCGAPMQVGIVTDNSQGSFTQARWAEGEPVTAKIFGIDFGTLDINKRQTLPLLAYRCPACSCVELFAFREDKDRDILLRPASGAGATPAEELLRGSDAPDTER